MSVFASYDKEVNDINEINKKRNYNLTLTIAVSVVLWLLVTIVFFTYNDIDEINFQPVSDYITSDVYYLNGDTVHFDNDVFGNIKKGDRVRLNINIPEDKKMEDCELYALLYNCVVDVYIDGEKVYQDECDPDNIASHYGGRIYEITLPDDYTSKTITLDMTAVVRLSSSEIAKMGIVRSNQAWKKIIAGHGFVFCISLTIVIMSIICIIYFLVKWIARKEVQIGLPVAIFELLINSWFFGSQGMFHLILGNMDLCAKIEYYCLYMAPVPLTIFIYLVLDKSVFKSIIKVISIMYSLFYIVVTAVELSPIQLNYSDMLSSVHIFGGVTILMLVIVIFLGTKKDSNSYIVILRFGVLISMMCGIIEILRFNITKYVMNKTWFSNKGVSYLAIIVIAVSLIVYLISTSAEEYTLRVERQQLVVLAYKDALTNMSNRADCYRKIEEMEANDIKDYTMVFIDLNNLKTANDVYGHEMGDRLLKVTATNIKKIFSDNGFCSRWGGDEFVACLYGGEDMTLDRIEQFKKLMKAEDESGSFPFEVSAACGYKCCSRDEYIAPMEAIRLADVMMYENKKVMKAKR